MIETYNGDQPFLFVSYSHADSEAVFAEIESFHNQGFRVWYDEGIDPGNDWPEEIARALDRSSLFVVFISPRAVASTNVQNEINFALNRRKPFLAIHLEETVLRVGLELRMGDIQAVMKYRMESLTYAQKVTKVLAAILGDPTECAETANDVDSGNALPLAEIETEGVAVVSHAAPSTVAAEELGVLRPKRAVTPLDDHGVTSVSLRVRSEAGDRNICLAAGFRFRLGKDRNNDVVMRVLPRSPLNDEHSMRISGYHADVVFEDGEVTWRNANCANGSVVAGQLLDRNEQAGLQHGITIQAADVLTLLVDLYHQEAFDPLGNYAAFDLEQRATVGERNAPTSVSAARLRRTDDLAGLEQYVLFPRSIMIGRDLNCAILISDASILEQHARLLLLRGGLWIEPAAADASLVVDGRRLHSDELAAIVPGTRIECGAVQIDVTPRFQHHLHWLDSE